MITNKKTFYALSFTWGIIMTFFGCVATIALLIAGHKPKKWGHCWYFEVGDFGGGFNLGPMFVVSKGSPKHTKNHEHGHGFQNCKYGPLTLFIVHIPSFIRFWYREFKYYKRGLEPTTDYDSAWYEGEASKLGTEFMETLKGN